MPDAQVAKHSFRKRSLVQRDRLGPANPDAKIKSFASRRVSDQREPYFEVIGRSLVTTAVCKWPFSSRSKSCRTSELRERPLGSSYTTRVAHSKKRPSYPGSHRVCGTLSSRLISTASASSVRMRWLKYGQLLRTNASISVKVGVTGLEWVHAADALNNHASVAGRIARCEIICRLYQAR